MLYFKKIRVENFVSRQYQDIKKEFAYMQCIESFQKNDLKAVKEYDAEITRIDMNHEDTNKSFVISVTDENLLELTGGIVQGMSGSPILQDGKLIGAVTHVFVQDARMGYGIYIGNMLNHVK